MAPPDPDPAPPVIAPVAVVETPAVPEPPAPIVLVEAVVPPVVKPAEVPKKEEKEKPDELIISYANDLKATLGDKYTPEYDKIPLRQRIEVMKHVVAALRGVQKTAEAHVPQPKPVKPKASSGKPNYKALGEKYK